jgi:flagellar basal-body rod modification protein FlgD
MPDPVSATTAPNPTPASTTVVRKDQGSQKDMFLKLLVAQMKYQDPSNPASSSEFMAQTATFTQVEKLEEIAAQNASMLALQRSSSAGALVGRTVSYTDDAGATQTGTVNAVRLGTGSTEATAMVGGVAVAMGRITEVATTAEPTPEPTPASTPSAS